ncbi:MAG TPA: hypothetical protein QGF02_00060 [Candidatus Babeliales bacterium]|nr:hypothetical protein [Candidatus Babeliales bacterium]
MYKKFFVLPLILVSSILPGNTDRLSQKRPTGSEFGVESLQKIRKTSNGEVDQLTLYSWEMKKEKKRREEENAEWDQLQAEAEDRLDRKAAKKEKSLLDNRKERSFRR